jgi:hypothetical protein
MKILHSQGAVQVSVSRQCFFRLWVRQFGRDGCTTYIHNLAEGHILYFMREYGYLSK